MRGSTGDNQMTKQDIKMLTTELTNMLIKNTKQVIDTRKGLRPKHIHKVLDDAVSFLKKNEYPLKTREEIIEEMSDTIISHLDSGITEARRDAKEEADIDEEMVNEAIEKARDELESYYS
jgi:hypothetical protein